MLYEQKCQVGEAISKHSYISLLELVLSMGGVEMAEQIRRLESKDILEYTKICVYVYIESKIQATHLCTELPLLCWIATVLEGLFREYHSSSAALGQQHPEGPHSL